MEILRNSHQFLLFYDCIVLFFGSVFSFGWRHLEVAMRKMNFRIEMSCVVSCVNKQPNLSAIAGFVLLLNSKVEGGWGNKLPFSESVTQIRLLKVPQ